MRGSNRTVEGEGGFIQNKINSHMKKNNKKLGLNKTVSETFHGNSLVLTTPFSHRFIFLFFMCICVGCLCLHVSVHEGAHTYLHTYISILYRGLRLISGIFLYHSSILFS